MSSEDMVLGSSPINPAEPCKLSFHQYLIYDRTWPSGTVKFNSITGEFFIVPDEVINNNTVFKPVNNIFKKN